MPKKVFTTFIIFTFLIISGCVGPAYVPPSGVSGSLLMTSVNYPSMQTATTNYNFTREDIELLGPVQVTTSSVKILGMISWGNNGYGELLDEARKVYPKTDALINIYLDTDYTNVLWFVFSKVTTRITALAVQIKRTPSKGNMFDEMPVPEKATPEAEMTEKPKPAMETIDGAPSPAVEELTGEVPAPDTTEETEEPAEEAGEPPSK